MLIEVIFLKKYEEKSNVCDVLIKESRKSKKLSKGEVCRRLRLHVVYIDRTELKRMEEKEMIIKDFELIALCAVLEINYEKNKNSFFHKKYIY